MNSDINDDVAGGPIRHIPVMLNEVLAVLKPTSGQSFIDGTFGAGGYSSAILDTGASVIGIDRDPDAIRDGAGLERKSAGRLKLVSGEFSKLDEVVEGQVDGVVLDIGVSSMQLDQAERGFSFNKDGPLDMRMAQSGVSAADVVNQCAQADLTRIIGLYGEERKASLISKAIVSARLNQDFNSTLQLSELIEKTVGRKAKDKIHPATRTFQALRIFVNQELEQLGRALFAAERILKAGGRLVVVTFHSLEDRMVKLFFKDRLSMEQGSRHLPMVKHNDATFEIRGKALLKASEEEATRNPRARSAKLRWGERTQAEARGDDMAIFGLPNLASIGSLRPTGVS
ncbi:MAG: 16S rRNA (cytosine(1402)-N(4))-methyltransferase RsmH [Pseudomonadota bacterium]